MLYTLIAVLLGVALSSRGMKPPGSMVLRTTNGIISVFLVLGHCSAIQEFWNVIRNPAALAEPEHVFNSVAPNLLLLIRSASIVAGVIAVFVGFALANRKRYGVWMLRRLVPFLLVAGVGRFLVGTFREAEVISLNKFFTVFFIGSFLCGMVYLSIYSFYRPKTREALFY